LEEGLKEGEKKGEKKVAQNLLKEGTDPKFVAKVTGLSEKQVNELLKKIKSQK